MEFIKKIFWNMQENRLRTFWRLLVFILILLAFFFLLTIPVTLIPEVFHLGKTGGYIIQTIGFVLMIVGATWICGKWIDRRPFSSYGFRFSRRWWMDFGFGLGLGAVLMLFIFLVELGAGWITIQGTFVDHSARGFWFGFGVEAIVFFCVGIYEEVFTRAFILRNLAEGLRLPFAKNRSLVGLILAILISSSMFGALHLGNENATIISSINIAIAGIFLATGYLLTGEMAIPIGLHMTWNFFQGVVFGFPVSGGGSAASVIGIEQGGPNWLTGGMFGPEAGVIGLAAIALGILLTILYVRLQDGKARLKTSLADYLPSESSIHQA